MSLGLVLTKKPAPTWSPAITGAGCVRYVGTAECDSLTWSSTGYANPTHARKLSARPTATRIGGPAAVSQCLLAAGERQGVGRKMRGTAHGFGLPSVRFWRPGRVWGSGGAAGRAGEGRVRHRVRRPDCGGGGAAARTSSAASSTVATSSWPTEANAGCPVTDRRTVGDHGTAPETQGLDEALGGQCGVAALGPPVAVARGIYAIAGSDMHPEGPGRAATPGPSGTRRREPPAVCGAQWLPEVGTIPRPVSASGVPGECLTVVDRSSSLVDRSTTST